MKKYTQSICRDSWKCAQKIYSNTIHKSHIFLTEKWSWYKWWHEQDYHQHVHLVAMVCGIILAIYIVMIDTITAEVNFF